MDRNNFPDFDAALRIGSHHHHQRQQQQQDGAVDEISSSVASPNSSLLDMSIGARAAMHEHLRHVEKYGIDGQFAENDNGIDNDHQGQLHHQQQQHSTASRNNPLHQQGNDLEEENTSPLERQWHKLLESDHGGSMADTNVSWSASSRVPDESWIAAIDPVHSFSEDGGEAVEIVASVMGCNSNTDNSNNNSNSNTDDSDYFNSSRVNLLASPLKQRRTGNTIFGRVGSTDQDDDFDREGPVHKLTDTRFVSTRDQSYTTEISEDDHQHTSGSDEGSSIVAGMAHMFQAAMAFEAATFGAAGVEAGADRDTSFLSLSGVDVSRISAAEDSLPDDDNRRVLLEDTSVDFSLFGNDEARLPRGIGAGFDPSISPAPGMASPSRSSNFLSPYQRGPSTPLRNSPLSSSSIHSGKPYATPKKTPTRSAGPPMLSPIAARAGFIAGKLLAKRSGGSSLLPAAADPFPHHLFGTEDDGPIHHQHQDDGNNDHDRHRHLVGDEALTNDNSLLGGSDVHFPLHNNSNSGSGNGSRGSHHHVDMPSPISQLNVSNTSDVLFIDVPSSSDDNIRTKANNSNSSNNSNSNSIKGKSSSSSNSGYRASSSSFGSSSSSARAHSKPKSTSSLPLLPTSLSDRRRYRTVVPARVFLAEPNEFPLQDDSFSTPSPTTERSLLQSFEAVQEDQEE